LRLDASDPALDIIRELRKQFDDGLHQPQIPKRVPKFVMSVIPWHSYMPPQIRRVFHHQTSTRPFRSLF